MSSPRIELSSERIVMDQEIQIRLTGFRPESQVTIIAELLDDKQTPWRSQATFSTDWIGSVDLSRAIPESGTYAGEDSHGLFWSMAPVPPEKYDEFKLKGASEEAVRTPPIFAYSLGVPYYESDRPDVIRFEALVDGSKVATTELIRDRFPVDVMETEVTDGRLRGLFFKPKMKKPLAGIVNIMGSGGGVDRQGSSLLASNGFAVLNLAYFNYRDLTPDHHEIPLEYFREGIEWLQNRLGHDRIGLVGISRGGEGVLAIAAAFPEAVAAVVAIVPGDVYCGDEGSPASSSWTLTDRPFPFAGTAEDMTLVAPEVLAILKSPQGRKIVFSQVMAPYMLNPAIYERAAIPIERIRCPILFISGRDDQTWPSYELSERAMKRLKEKEFSFPYKHIGFEDAGHMITFPGLPTAMADSAVHPVYNDFFTLGGQPAAIARAQRRAWKERITFCKDVLYG